MAMRTWALVLGEDSLAGRPGVVPLLDLGAQADLGRVVAAREGLGAGEADEGHPELRVLAEAVAADGAGELQLLLVDEAVFVRVGLEEHGGEDAGPEHLARDVGQPAGLEERNDAGLGQVPVLVVGIDCADGVEDSMVGDIHPFRAGRPVLTVLWTMGAYYARPVRSRALCRVVSANISCIFH